jgi:hypothetical protein
MIRTGFGPLITDRPMLERMVYKVTHRIRSLIGNRQFELSMPTLGAIESTEA